MKKSLLALYITTGISFLLFVTLAILLKFVNTAPIGPNESIVGFSTINGSIHNSLGSNDTWYKISEILGFVAIAIAGIFAILALIQLIKRKKLSLIDKQFWFLFSIYALTIVFYIVFELIVINYRPVLIEGELEASFPSSHTMLACIILMTAIFSTNLISKSKIFKIIFISFCIIIMLLIVIGRLLSGVHWFTDIIGGILLSTSLILTYLSLIKTFPNKQE